MSVTSDVWVPLSHPACQLWRASLHFLVNSARLVVFDPLAQDLSMPELSPVSAHSQAIVKIPAMAIVHIIFTLLLNIQRFFPQVTAVALTPRLSSRRVNSAIVIE